ncbi:MAG: 16S rRNA (cytosine(1402)-N(4))-methyltransferase RsmH [Patescibacteria group bacterium UBA2163]
MKNDTHTTVLLHESVLGLNISQGDTIIDATLGLGGHSALLAEHVGPQGKVLGIDADKGALMNAQRHLADLPQMCFALGNFRDIDQHADKAGIKTVDGILFDLGWNSTQLISGRGFSFKADEPLRMTYAVDTDDEQVTAETIVNEWSEDDLKEMIHTLGEERFAGRIAQAIITARRTAPITHSVQLADIITESVPMFYRKGKINPATKTFQALRMMVNDELSSIVEVLPKALDMVRSGGRIAVITFHSLEDGLVKRQFRTFEDNGVAVRITKKPITPQAEEIKNNPRARSAKLRIIEKL